MRGRNHLAKLAIIGIFASATFVGEAAAATAASQKSDLECLLLSNVFSKPGNDPKAQQAAYAAHFFYLGKLSGEITASQLPPAISDAAKGIVPATAGTKMQACVKDVQASETSVEGAAKQIKLPAGK